MNHLIKNLSFIDFNNIKSDCLDITKLAESFGSSLVNWTHSGFQETPPEILVDREKICKDCNEWNAQALNGTGRCKICKCSTWAKLRIATEHCPIGKWEAVDKTTE
jgi:hypothetical protein